MMTPRRRAAMVALLAPDSNASASERESAEKHLRKDGWTPENPSGSVAAPPSRLRRSADEVWFEPADLEELYRAALADAATPAPRRAR